MLKCPHCSSLLKSSGVYGVGLRENTKKGQIELLFGFDYKCEKCKNYSTFSGFKTTHDAFISDIMEIYSNVDNDPGEITKEDEIEKKIEKKQNIKKSCISDEEVQSIKNFLNECDNFNDLLHKLGVLNISKDTDENK